jgi:GT2 family glycosyltransferase/glycosyltransferase involved in cell wall biosynthesis
MADDVTGRVSVERKRKRIVKKKANIESLATSEITDLAKFENSIMDQMFVEQLYLALNPDVVSLLCRGDFSSAWEHWDIVGREETKMSKRPLLGNSEFYEQETSRRLISETEAYALNTEAYLYLNPDVRIAIGEEPENARQHWIKYGRRENRRAPGIAPFRARKINFGVMANRPFGLNIFGPFMASTGLGTACRNMLAAFRETQIQFDVWNFDVKLGTARVAVLDKLRLPKFNTNIIFANADQIEHLFLAFPEKFFDNAYNIAVWQWELASFRPDWFSAFGAVDEIWTNSSFQASAIRAVAPVPVFKVHLPIISTNSVSTLTRNDLGISESAFVFLMPFDIGSTVARKNPLAGIVAFKEAFGYRDDVALIVKYQAPEHDKEFGLKLSLLTSGISNIRVVAETLSSQDMAKLRILSDALLSPHRSEGFGLNIGEFMALGKSIIATNYSGNTDFFDETTGYPVSYSLSEIARTTGPYPAGYIWAEPCHQSLVEQLRLVINNPEDAKRRGQRAKTTISENFCPSRIAWDIIARLRSIGLDQTLPAYTKWICQSHEIRTPSPACEFGTGLRPSSLNLAKTPLFSVIMPVYNVEGELLERAIMSLMEQTYPFWELCIANDASTNPETIAVLNRLRGKTPYIKIVDLIENVGIARASNVAASLATGEFIAFLDNDDQLSPHALNEIATSLNKDLSVDCFYTDEIKIDRNGREIEHFFKPDWSPEHLESVMYVLHLLVVRKKVFFEIGQLRPEYDGAQDYDLMLRLSRATTKICHISKPLYQWRAIPGSAALTVDAKPKALDSGFRALEDHVAKKYGLGSRVERGLLEGTFRVRRDTETKPPVNLLVLTNNIAIDLPSRGKINLVRNFVESIFKHTEYPNYEVIVVDNSMLSKNEVDYLTSLGARVLNYEFTGKFNYSAKANFAIKRCPTDLLVLLNDDMEVITPGWLDALIEFSQVPDIGAVGGRLLHADRSLQHAGVVLGINGTVGHIYHNATPDFVGYNGFTHIIRNYSAVTAACLATRKSVVMHAGGFDERFPTDFNDIDLCLRIRDAGFRIVYTPYCELFHFEGASIPRRVQDDEERDLFIRRWLDVVVCDPYYNINLSRTKLDYSRAS